MVSRHHLEDAVGIAFHLLEPLSLVVAVTVFGDADVLVELQVGVVVVEQLESVWVADDAPLEVVEVETVVNESGVDVQYRFAGTEDHLSLLVALAVVVHQIVPVLVGVVDVRLAPLERAGGLVVVCYVYVDGSSALEDVHHVLRHLCNLWGFKTGCCVGGAVPVEGVLAEGALPVPWQYVEHRLVLLLEEVHVDVLCLSLH